MEFPPNFCARAGEVHDTKANGELVYMTPPGYGYPNEPVSRATYHEADPFVFTMYIDIHDFKPSEIAVEFVDNVSAVIVSAKHEIENNDEAAAKHDESREFSDRYSLPANLQVHTLRWNFSTDKSQIIITANKVADLNVENVNIFRNIPKHEVVYEQRNGPPLVFLQSIPQPFPGRQQDVSASARQMAALFPYNQSDTVKLQPELGRYPGCLAHSTYQYFW